MKRALSPFVFFTKNPRAQASFEYRFALAALSLLIFIFLPMKTVRASEATSTAPPNPLASPGAGDTQVFWQKRARDSLIIQAETQRRHLSILQSYHDHAEFSRLRTALGAFCSANEDTRGCFQRYKRSESRRIEEVRGGILQSETEITRLRNDLPGQGGNAIQMGGEITPGNGSSESEAPDYRSFTPSTRSTISLSAPAYIPTLAELEEIERSGRPGRLARGLGTTSAEAQLIEWQQRTFSNQAERENYALFEIVTPTGAGSSGRGSPLRRTVGTESTLQVNEQLLERVNRSLVDHQSHDTQNAHDARQAGIRAIDAETRAREVGTTPLESRLTEEQRRAYYETRGDIIRAYQGELSRGTNPNATAPGSSTTSRAPSASTPSTSATNPVSTTETQVTSGGGTPPPRGASYDDAPVGDRLPSTGNFNIYTDPTRYDEEIGTLRELDSN